MHRIRTLLDNDAPVTWLFYGDSITHGAVHTFGWRDYTQLFAERVRVERRRHRDAVLNTAVNGDTTRGLLAGFEERVARFAPGVVLLMIGMNDCCDRRGIGLPEFAANLNTIADRSAAWQGTVVFQTSPPILPGLAPDREPQFPAFMDAVRAVARARGLPLVDHAAEWQALQPAHRRFYWMSDPFHPNEYGHRALARTLFREFGLEDPHSATCRLFIP